jgi:hypothetical protein
VTVFLMLFSEYRDLLAEQAEQRSENARLIGEASSANARAEEAEKRVEDLKRVVDSYSHQATRRYVFAKAEAPVSTPVVLPEPRKRMARDVAAERTREAFARRQQDLHQAFVEESETA